ncbi:alpha-hydroxy-acid oxidizing protein [Corynebacterium variabile]|uniref:alpha-hydroxy-acid oxidizing protein n=1 Tax=Corynebacterium variabile TaxID=1727 RepID=UPI0028A13B5F|nr:alpha-hydroxy-acid oxidizing protein [Corynebacterium variabile]
MVSRSDTQSTFLSLASAVAGAGRARQDRIYRAGVSGLRPSVPTDAAGLEGAARRHMSRKAWAYVAGGAGEGRTMDANRESFYRHRLVPRMAHGVKERDLTVSLFGEDYASPVLLAPIGASALVDKDADLLTARAAAATGVPMVISNQGCSPLEDTAAAAAPAGHWFQLYWSTDEELVDSLIRRAEASGAGALVVTLDTTVLGWRPQDLTLGSLPFSRGQGIAQYTSDSRYMDMVRTTIRGAGSDSSGDVRITPAAAASLLSMARHHPGRTLRNLLSPEPRAAVETFLGTYSNPGLDWDMLATLRDRTSLPVVFKGILDPEDAERAFAVGADAVVVSNHGGRQVDGSVSSLDALIEIRRHLGDEPTLLLDSGIRTGRDVAVALALGADAVLLGRPWMYGLAVAGRRGAEEVIQNVLAELELTMALCGAKNVAGLRGTRVVGHA